MCTRQLHGPIGSFWGCWAILAAVPQVRETSGTLGYADPQYIREGGLGGYYCTRMVSAPEILAAVWVQATGARLKDEKAFAGEHGGLLWCLSNLVTVRISEPSRPY